jgi:hypothetical protein
MIDFKPSDNFVDRVMNEIRAYEMNVNRQKNRIGEFAFSRPVLSMLYAGGILLGILNIIRMSLILLAPAPCF